MNDAIGPATAFVKSTTRIPASGRRFSPVRFDGAVLQIGAHNAYARDWLDNRIRSTAERLLVGILDRSVAIIFVAMEDS